MAPTPDRIVRLGKRPLRTTWRPAGFIKLVAMRLDPLGDFRVDGLGQHPLRSLTKNARQHVLRRRGWHYQSISDSFMHGGVPLGENGR